MLACSTDLALAVLAGIKALDAAYGEVKKAKQQLDGKGVAKSLRAAKMRRRKRSAGDHNHAGPHAENPEPGDTPEVIRDRAYTWQAGEALRLAHENKLAPIDPEERAKFATPLARAGRASEIAQGVLYLASDASRYVTGTELVIDGGMNAGGVARRA